MQPAVTSCNAARLESRVIHGLQPATVYSLALPPVAQPMKKVIQPDGLFDSSQFHYSQVVMATGGTLVHISGLAAWNKHAQLVGGDDLVAQTRQTLANVRAGLEAAGASIDDLIMMRSFIVNYRPEYFGLLMPEFAAFFGDARPPASTWVGVQALALPDLLIEIEAQAMVAG